MGCGAGNRAASRRPPMRTSREADPPRATCGHPPSRLGSRSRFLEKRGWADAFPHLARQVRGLDDRLDDEPVTCSYVGRLAAVGGCRKPAEVDRSIIHPREAAKRLPPAD